VDAEEKVAKDDAQTSDRHAPMIQGRVVQTEASLIKTERRRRALLVAVHSVMIEVNRVLWSLATLKMAAVMWKRTGRATVAAAKMMTMVIATVATRKWF